MRPEFLREIPARSWLSVLLAVVVCLAGWQVWLTMRLLDQDRNLELQRTRERLGGIADLAVAQLAGSLGGWDIGLRDLGAFPPSSAQLARLPWGATFVLASKDGIKIYPQRPLIYSPITLALQALPPDAFGAADQLELREQQYDRAIAALRPLAQEPASREEALLRIARIEYKIRRLQDALATYKSLANDSSVNASGTPYALLAATARCRILMELGRPQEASAEVDALRGRLLEGRWRISREAFEYHWAELDRIGAASTRPPQASIDFANLVANLFGQWQSAQVRGANSSGRELLPDLSLLVWNATPERLSALAAPPGWMDSSLKLPANSGDVRWKLLTPGASSQGGFTVGRSLAEAQLPGRLEFSSLRPISGAAANRRALLIGGAAVMLLVILGAGYVVYRAISRELGVAQLQSDFVAAVSHEFRAPLTTLRTITELLAQNRITDETRRQKSYVFLDRETTRLHRLVEDLLDFGRMESGRKQYRMAAHDAFQLLRGTLADFSEQAQALGFHLEAAFDPGSPPATASVLVDEDAFGRALRNLLDNAIKYSPVCRTVWVDSSVVDRQVLISVRDQGMGIGAEEQQAVFQKFVRGQHAKEAGIKGTGIGLAMVRQIAQAMGGEIRLQSEAGVGSTFTLVLPLAED